MYKVAVCDSDKLFVSHIRNIINQCSGNNKYSFEINEFDSEKDLISAIENGVQFDLLIWKEAEAKVGQKYIVGHYRNKMIKVNVRNILYIENAKRGSKIVLCTDCVEEGVDRKIIVDDKLETLSGKFPEFVFAHRSYIVNTLHIQKIDGNELYLDNGECLSVSRAYRKSIRESFIKSVEGKIII